MEFRGELVQIWCDETKAQHFFRVKDGPDFMTWDFRKLKGATMAQFREVHTPHLESLIQDAKQCAVDLACKEEAFVTVTPSRCVISLYGDPEIKDRMSGFLLHADA